MLIRFISSVIILINSGITVLSAMKPVIRGHFNITEKVSSHIYMTGLSVPQTVLSYIHDRTVCPTDCPLIGMSLV